MLTKEDLLSLDLSEAAADLVAEALRRDSETRSAADARLSLLTEALRQRGAAEETLPLLLSALCPENACVEEGRLVNAEELLSPLEKRYPSLFEAPDSLCPPLSPMLPLRRDSLARLTPEEINACWPQVKAALAE